MTTQPTIHIVGCVHVSQIKFHKYNLIANFKNCLNGIYAVFSHISIHILLLRFAPFEKVFSYLFKHRIGKHVLFLFVISKLDNFLFNLFISKYCSHKDKNKKKRYN